MFPLPGKDSVPYVPFFFIQLWLGFRDKVDGNSQQLVKGQHFFCLTFWDGHFFAQIFQNSVLLFANLEGWYIIEPMVVWLA